MILDEPTGSTAFPRRRPAVAFIFSWLAPGLGHCYNGQVKRGLIWFGTGLGLLLLAGLTRLAATSFAGFVGVYTVYYLWRFILVPADAAMQTRRYQPVRANPWNTWWPYLLCGVIWMLSGSVITRNVLGIRIFSITGTSGMPTMLIGDMVVADMWCYSSHTPEIGDLTVIQHNDQYYTFRIVADGGDVISIDRQTLSINNTPVSVSKLEDLTIDGLPVENWEETLPGGKTHQLYYYTRAFVPEMEQMQPLTMPPDHYFLLGDFRNNAADSRVIGPIAKENVLGKIKFTYWNPMVGLKRSGTILK